MPRHIDLNSASREELESVRGIDGTRATRIIEYRDRHGGFKSVDELERVEGFGEHLTDDFRGAFKVRDAD